MRRARVSSCAAALFVALGVHFSATSTQAAPVTLNFSGTVDFSAVGGPAVNTFSGFVTWESTASPFETEPGFATYDVVAYSLIFNGLDATLPIIGDGTGNGIGVSNDADPFGVGFDSDGVGFFASISGPFSLAGDTGDLIFLAAMIGPTTMFSSTALPGNLDFLGLLTTTASVWFLDSDTSNEEPMIGLGTLVVSAPNGEPSVVPEPATLTLTALGLVGALARARRARRAAQVS